MFRGLLLAQGSHVLTLKQSVDLGIKNNLAVRQSALLAENSEINLKQSKAGILPTIAANINHGSNQGRSIDPFTNSYIDQSILFGNYNLGASVILLNGGLIKNLIRQNQINYEAGKMEAKAAKDNLTLNIILSYLQVLSNQDLLKQANTQAELTTKQVERLETLNKEGAIVPAQLYDLKGQLANDQLTVINSTNQLEASKLALTQLMNIPFDPQLELTPVDIGSEVSLYSDQPATIFKTALGNFSQIQAAAFRVKLASAEIAVAKSGLYPQLSLSGGLSTNYSNAAARDILIDTKQVPSGDYVSVNGNQYPVITSKSNFNTQKIPYANQFANNYNTSVSINLHIPILNAFQARTRIALAKNDLRNYKYIEESQKNQLQQGIEQAYFNMTASLKRYNKLQEQVEDFIQSFKSAEIRFNNGVITQVDYLVAKNNLDRSRTNLITSRYEYLFQTKILDYFKGILVL